MNKIKCISRSWLYPNNTEGVKTEEFYYVGIMGVKDIYQNDIGGFTIQFDSGQIICVFDIVYIEYFAKQNIDNA